ncbi:hypothetical protein [Pseudomonas aeruginosa]|uniref:hypothetical protein n=1 Tax=Pseudomonas aeruginosa TaxID=287 RepID=UPI0032B61FD2|nr:hypothetical protein [Pseudomonas aeruginosa]HCH7782535.1 hypothetical protein [Pseudomonas aeruginosa]
MNLLEQNIIKEVKAQQSIVHAFGEKLMARTATLDDRFEYDRAWGAFTALLSLAHIHDSGLSDEAANALREIERAEAQKAWTPQGHPLAKLLGAIPNANGSAEVCGSSLAYRLASKNGSDQQP